MLPLRGIVYGSVRTKSKYEGKENQGNRIGIYMVSP